MSSRWRASVFVLALPAACSSSGEGPKDAAADVRNDIAFPEDATTDAPGVCGPVDVTGYQPKPLVPPNAPHGYKCTTQQTADYAQCQGAQVTSLCKQFADGQSGQACRQCIETQVTDSRWGVIVFAGSSGTGTVNIEGCVDDALGQTSKEKASGGNGSCGDALFASYGCQTQACDSCAGADFDTCTQTALDNGCKSYDQAVQSATGPCSILLSDAAPPDANACFPDTSITDPTQQEVDWLTRIVGYMCGP